MNDIPVSSLVHAEFHKLNRRVKELLDKADVPVDASNRINELRDYLMEMIESREEDAQPAAGSFPT